MCYDDDSILGLSGVIEFHDSNTGRQALIQIGTTRPNSSSASSNMSPEQMMPLTQTQQALLNQFGYNRMSNTTSGAVGQTSVTPAGQKTILPNAFYAMTLQDPVPGNCDMDTANYSSPTADTASSTVTHGESSFLSTTMGEENPIRTLRDYSKPSHKGYRNTIELPVGNNVVPLRSDTIRGPYDTQNYMENPEQAFVEYASSRTDEVGGKRYTFKPEQNNLGDTYNPSWKSHPNLRWRQPQNFQNNFSNPPNQFQPNGSIPNRPFNNHPRNFNNQSNIKGLVSEFMASQDARRSKFKADFKRQQGEMTNKIDAVLKAITDQIAGTLPSDTVRKLNSMLESLGLVPQSSNTKFVCSKEGDDEVMFIEIIRDDDEPQNENPNVGEEETTEEPVAEYFDIFPTKDELAYHRLSLVVLGRPFVEISNMTHDTTEGVVRFVKGSDEVAYKMPHKIEQYNSPSDLEKEHTKSVYLINEEDKRRGMDYVMSKILGFYKECLEVGPEYLTGMENNGEVT
nr:MAK10-like protein [Tanacetum cinerariifolium]